MSSWRTISPARWGSSWAARHRPRAGGPSNPPSDRGKRPVAFIAPQRRTRVARRSRHRDPGVNRLVTDASGLTSLPLEVQARVPVLERAPGPGVAGRHFTTTLPFIIEMCPGKVQKKE